MPDTKMADAFIFAAFKNGVEMAGMRATFLHSHAEYGGLVSDIASQILRIIEISDAVIVDITGRDPNIMYQLGFAHALKKPVLPIIEKDSGAIPFNLQGYLFFVYEDNDSKLDELSRIIGRWLERNVVER